MKHLILAESREEFQQYKDACDAAQERLNAYITFLKAEYQVYELPRAVLWASAGTATNLLSDIPIPAYTNDFRTVFCPDIDAWREIYLRQLDDMDSPDIREYYEAKLTKNHVLQILGHEFVHHSDLFIDEAYENAMWFEEGMCEYISRKFFLTDAEFQEEARINKLLVKLHRNAHSPATSEDFSTRTYSKTYADIFYQYWRSFLAVNSLVARYEGNVMAVFHEYHRWFENSGGKTLEEWFETSIE